MAGLNTSNQLGVYYMSGQGHVDQFLLPAHATAWQNIDLTAESGGVGVTSHGGITVLPLQSLPNVFYLGD